MSKQLIRNIPTRNQSDVVWIAWYDALRKQFGRKKANALYSANWDAQNGSNSDANTRDLREHLKNKGKLEISGGFTGELKDKVFDVGNFFGDYLTVGKYLGIALGVIVVGGLGLFIYNIARKPETAVRVGSAIATRGMSEGIPKK